MEDLHLKYIVVAEGQMFTRLNYNAIGNPEGHATIFDIGRVQALAYDNSRGNQEVVVTNIYSYVAISGGTQYDSALDIYTNKIEVSAC